MGNINLIKSIFIILSMTFFGDLIAENRNNSVYGLFLSPEKCLLLEASSNCDILVTISWQLANKENVCLYHHLSTKPLGCWKDEKQATTSIYLKLKKDLEFELRLTDTNKTIFSSPLKIYKKITKLRRKRRNPWSFY